MTYRFFTVAACIFSFLVLAGAGGLPTSNTSGSSSTSSSGGGSNALVNPLNALELKNGLNLVQSLVYGKKYKKAEKKLISLEVKFPKNADIQNYLGFVSRKTDKLGKSAAYYKKALQIAPNLPLNKIITHRLPLTEVESAFEVVFKQKQVCKILLDCSN